MDNFPANYWGSIYDRDEEDMDMPCVCDCGKVFDLNKGFATKKYNSNVVICPECHRKEVALEREIEKLESEAEELDYLNKKPKTAHKLLQKANELKDQLFY